MMLSGSITLLIVFMSSTVSSPSSSTRYSFLPTPTPCSPVPDHKSERVPRYANAGKHAHVPSIRIARRTSRCTASPTACSSSSSLNKISAWKLPTTTSARMKARNTPLPTDRLLHGQLWSTVTCYPQGPSSFHTQAAAASTAAHCAQP